MELNAIVPWIIAHWPWCLLAAIALGGGAMVRTATVLARKRAL